MIKIGHSRKEMTSLTNPTKLYHSKHIILLGLMKRMLKSCAALGDLAISAPFGNWLCLDYAKNNRGSIILRGLLFFFDASQVQTSSVTQMVSGSEV